MNKKLLLLIFCCTLKSYAIFEFGHHKGAWGALNASFMQELVNTFKIDIFFETGSYEGHTALNAAGCFKEVHTVELQPELFMKTLHTLSECTNVTAYQGSSPEIIKTIAPQIKGRILFWLDAHYSGEETALSCDDREKAEAFTPIRAELAAIKEAGIKDCIIIIDDIRGFGIEIAGKRFDGCWAYPTVQELQQHLGAINPDFEYALLGDMLLAYDGTKYQPHFSGMVVACTKTRLYDGYNLSEEDLLAYQEQIKYAPEDEKYYIKHLYNTMSHYKDPMFWHDLWYGLIQMGSENYLEAYIAFSKVKEQRTQHFVKDYPDNKILAQQAQIIDAYLDECFNKIVS